MLVAIIVTGVVGILFLGLIILTPERITKLGDWFIRRDVRKELRRLGKEEPEDDWFYWKNISEIPYLSPEFIWRHRERLDWNIISKTQCIEDLYERYGSEVDNYYKEPK